MPAKKKLLVVTAAALLAGPMAANAIPLTFEGAANTIYAAPITRSGFVIGNVAGDEQHFHEIDSTNFGLPSNGTGVLLNDRNTRIFLEEAGGANFLLGSFDVAAALGNSPALGISIQGLLDGVSVGIISLASLGNGYTNLNGGLFGSIDRLVFDGIGSGGGFVLDNINVDRAPVGVPEPGTLALFGLGLAGLALLRRRRSA